MRSLLSMTTNQFNPYRMRLTHKDLVDGETRGLVRFVLPEFEAYVLEHFE